MDICLDLTAIDRLDDATVAAVTFETFVAVVAAETYRAECEFLSGDDAAHRRAWEG